MLKKGPTPTAARRRCSMPFRSPMTTAAAATAAGKQTSSSVVEHAATADMTSTSASHDEAVKVAVLRDKELQEAIDSLSNEGLKVSELDTFILQLHKYNEVKDLASSLIGHLAELSQCSVTEVYHQLGLSQRD